MIEKPKGSNSKNQKKNEVLHIVLSGLTIQYYLPICFPVQLEPVNHPKGSYSLWVTSLCFLYDISKGMLLFCIIEISTRQTSSFYTIILGVGGLELYLVSYLMEVDDE